MLRNLQCSFYFWHIGLKLYYRFLYRIRGIYIHMKDVHFMLILVDHKKVNRVHTWKFKIGKMWKETGKRSMSPNKLLRQKSWTCIVYFHWITFIQYLKYILRLICHYDFRINAASNLKILNIDFKHIVILISSITLVIGRIQSTTFE